MTGPYRTPADMDLPTKLEQIKTLLLEREADHIAESRRLARLSLVPSSKVELELKLADEVAVCLKIVELVEREEEE